LNAAFADGDYCLDVGSRVGIRGLQPEGDASDDFPEVFL
jgi:hypothetical protein